MQTTVSATVVFLRDEKGRICLAPKKDDIHTSDKVLAKSRKRNGYGGKQEKGETILQAAIRELWQESGVVAKESDLELVGEIGFIWPGNETLQPDMLVYFFFLSEYTGEPREGKEMGVPEFFFPNEIPYHEMMPADRLFVPRLLAGERLTWDVHLGKKTPDGNVYFEDKRVVPTL